MEFGSDFVYEYDQLEYEVISDEEYEAGMEVSDSDSDSDPDPDTVVADSIAETTDRDVPVPPPLPKRSAKLKAKKRGHWRSGEAITERSSTVPSVGRRERRADTNIVSINFQTVVTPSNMHTGDAVYCDGCQAILSHLSKLEDQGEVKVWTCEFCGQKMEVDMVEEEKPTQDDVTFMLSPALSTTASGPTGTDNSLVIFCIDVSGSMCITTEVPGKLKLRGGGSSRNFQRLNDDRRDQYLPSQKRNVTYVSRLQAVQAAVDQQLEEMSHHNPKRRVALIIFNNEVVVIGDGKGTPVTIAGDKLMQKEELVKIGTDLPIPGDIKSTRTVLSKKIFELEEGGATALGPALLVATMMASQQAGSKVIICTDGLANVGLGRLDISTAEVQGNSLDFYESVAESASDKGVSVSVISMKGTDCRLIQLGKVADKTGGQINIVDPLKLTQEFSTILEGRIIATNVVATFILHKQLFFHYEETQESKVVKNVGNVTSDTEVTFEYGVRTKSEAKKDDQGSSPSTSEEIPREGAVGGQSSKSSDMRSDAEQPKELPFQLQVKYTDTEGATALRVLTKTKPVTKDRNVAEKKMNMDVVGKHTAQVSANLALEGMYTQARGRALMNQRLAWRNKKSDSHGTKSLKKKAKETYENMFSKVRSVENYLNVAQHREMASTGRTYSDDEDDEDEETEKVLASEFAVQAPRPMGMASGSSLSAPPMTGGSNSLELPKKSRKMLKVSRTTETSDEAAQMLYELKTPSKVLKK